MVFLSSSCVLVCPLGWGQWMSFGRNWPLNIGHWSPFTNQTQSGNAQIEKIQLDKHVTFEFTSGYLKHTLTNSHYEQNRCLLLKHKEPCIMVCFLCFALVLSFLFLRTWYTRLWAGYQRGICSELEHVCIYIYIYIYVIAPHQKTVFSPSSWKLVEAFGLHMYRFIKRMNSSYDTL